MSILVPINGVNYIIPTPGETGWGSNLDAFFVAISSGTLQKTGGNFLLSSETDFGASFGLRSLYYRSESANPAATGVVRLANSDTVSFRNFANNADIPLGINTSNQLTFNGIVINPFIETFTPNTALIADGSGNPISSTTTSTEIGYVHGVTSAIQTQLDLKAPIASPTFTGTVTIPTPFTLGAISVTTTGTELNFVAGVTSSIQTQLNSKQPTLTTGNLTDAGTDGITVTGGTGAVIGSGTSLSQHVADSSHNGYLASSDWTTFNGKQPALGYTPVNRAGDTMSGVLDVPNTDYHVAGNPIMPVVQVIQTNNTTQTTTTSTSFVDTALTLTISPKFNTSKVMISVTSTLGSADPAFQSYATITRNGSNLFGADGTSQIANVFAAPLGITYYDSPATTSSVTYTVQIRTSGNTAKLGTGTSNNIIIATEYAQ